MKMPETIRGKVDHRILQKADRLFRNDDKGTLIEVLQNARRAGATRVNVVIEEISAEPIYCVVTVEDNGCGIEDFQNLVTLGRSEWDQHTQDTEDPAGMGFFSLCQSGVEVTSLTKTVTLSQDVFLGKADAQVTDHDLVAGTRLRFTRQTTRRALSAVLASVAEFCPLDVRLNGELLPRHDFLEGAIYRECIDGIEVGFATKFTHEFTPHADVNWNFYGATIRESFLTISGILNANHGGAALALHARFNVLETGRIKLQLPDRRAVIQSEFLTQFQIKARAAAYRCFEQQAQHALPFARWKDARELGIQLQEAACLLTTWSVSARDSDIEPLFGYGETTVVPNLDQLLLVNSDLLFEHTLQAALHSGAKLDFALYEENPAFQGYSWYDQLPRITDTDVLLDGVPYAECTKKHIALRPKAIELKVTIEQAERESQIVRLPALIHADTEEYGSDPYFVAVQDSPWDKGEAGPFSLDEFLMWTTFLSSDDWEADSWQTQRDYHQDLVDEAICHYFQGPRGSLLSQLRKALNFGVTRQAELLGIIEIKFSRTSEGKWNIELNGSDRPTA